MSSKINQKLEVITELQSELTTIRNKVSSIKRMMIDHHKLNIQNTKINLSFSENTNETENKDEFKTWIDLQREEMIKNKTKNSDLSSPRPPSNMYREAIKTPYSA